MILITGTSGQLGSELANLYKQTQVILMSHKNLDINNSILLQKLIEENEIRVIINCAAYTNVEMAETNSDLCHQVNAIAVKNLSKISAEMGVKLIHVSTDYVFDGNNYKPYIESDPTNPKSVYGNSKLEGENYFLEYANQGAIIRTSWLYSEYGNNFVKTILNLSRTKNELKLVYDQIGSPTYARDFALCIKEILPKINGKEILHFSNEGIASWYDLAYEITKIKNIDCKLIPVRSEDFPTKAKRPHYSVLDKQKIKDKYQINIRHWKEALDECLKRIY